MKTNYLLLLFCVLACFNTESFGQFENFDLSSYKNPYYKRQGLDFGFNFSGSNRISKPFDLTSNSNLFSGSGSFSSSYFKVLNSADLQQNTNASLSYYGTISNSKNDAGNINDYTQKNRNQSLFLNFSKENRYYFDRLFFFELGVNFGLTGTTNHTIFDRTGTGSSNYHSDDKSKTMSLDGELSIKAGKGRIEYVEDARISIYILQELKKLNRLSRVPDDEEILELSKLITQVKNKRFFDSRIHRIEELTAVDSFFRSRNLISSSDAAYFTTLYDYWDNSNSQKRISGLRYDVGIIPQGRLNPGKIKSFQNQPPSLPVELDYSTHSNNYGLSGIAEIDYYKPISLNWQFSFGASLEYTTLKNFIKPNQDSEYSYCNHRWDAQLSTSLGYYPNSRTYLESNFRMVYSHYKYTEGDIYPLALQNDFLPALSVNAYYYISPRVTLSGSFYLSYQRSGFTNITSTSRDVTHEFYNTFNVSLGYKLF